MARDPLICIVDDDEAIRESLRLLLYASGLGSHGYPSADAFLADDTPREFDCMLLDIRMPGMDGLELFRILQRRQVAWPIIFITGHGDIPMAVEAMHLGAHDFVQKPFHDQELLDRIQAALSANREQQDDIELKRSVRDRYETLTPREAEVMSAVVKGHANKVIAMDLDLSQRTVEIHRARVMEKMQVRSLAELVKLSVILDS